MLHPPQKKPAHLRLACCLRSKVMDFRLSCLTRLVASRLSLWRIWCVPMSLWKGLMGISGWNTMPSLTGTMSCAGTGPLSVFAPSETCHWTCAGAWSFIGHRHPPLWDDPYASIERCIDGLSFQLVAAYCQGLGRIKSSFMLSCGPATCFAAGRPAHPSMQVSAEVAAECSTWDARLAREEALCREPWRSGLLLPVKPVRAGAAAGHDVALRAGGWPEGVPRKPWRDEDLGVEALEVRLLSAYARCPANRIYPQI